MGILDKFKRKVETTLADSRLEEELIYKHILEEMNSGVIRDGLYAKAMANSNGDEAMFWQSAGNEAHEGADKKYTLMISSGSETGMMASNKIKLRNILVFILNILFNSQIYN